MKREKKQEKGDIFFCVKIKKLLFYYILCNLSILIHTIKQFNNNSNKKKLSSCPKYNFLQL